MRYHALIPAAGGGTRFGAAKPKQYLMLAGKAVLQHAIERLAFGMPLERTYVLLAKDDAWYDLAVGAVAGVTAMHCGGGTRAETVRNGLAALSHVADDDDWIVVHDAVRPCIDAASLSRLRIELADDPVGGLLAVPMASALKRADGDKRITGTEPRAALWQAQTPQMFRYGMLYRALCRPGAELATDESQAVEALGAHPRLVMGSSSNLKITYPDDLTLAEALLATEHSGSTPANRESV